jgi:hypothetical protein
MFRVSNLQFEHFPDRQTVERALSEFGLPEEHISAALKAYICNEQRNLNEGYQKTVAHDLQKYLENKLPNEQVVLASTRRYSDRLNEQADLAFSRIGSDRVIFFEIEFRPNVEKDLVKFQIGYNTSHHGSEPLY